MHVSPFACVRGARGMLATTRPPLLPIPLPVHPLRLAPLAASPLRWHEGDGDSLATLGMTWGLLSETGI